VADHESSKPGERETHSLVAAESGEEHGFGEFHYYVPQEILDVSFPVSVRGYDRRAVDAYITRVNRVIAELKVSASPPAAVRHALEQAEGKVQGLLQAARAAGEEITASAQQEAEESTARAKAEAAELVVNTSAEAERVKAEADELIANARTEAESTAAKAKAEAQNTLARAQAEADERHERLQEELAALREEAGTRLRELQADTEALSKERRELLDDIRRMAGGLVDLADAAARRFPRQGPSGPEEQKLEPEAGDETESRGVATDESAHAVPAVVSHEGAGESREEVAERTASGPDT